MNYTQFNHVETPTVSTASFVLPYVFLRATGASWLHNATSQEEQAELVTLHDVYLAEDEASGPSAAPKPLVSVAIGLQAPLTPFLPWDDLPEMSGNHLCQCVFS